jgi:alpha-ketoglutarate-dependent taurine dioxygenase
VPHIVENIVRRDYGYEEPSGNFEVLVFRDQKISLDAHKRFARHFGRLHRHELAQSNIIAGRRADPELLSWKTGPESRFTAGDAWHSDVTCDEEPIAASFLHVTKSPAFGAGDTAFANNYLAYESLSEPLRKFVDGLTAVHDGAKGWAQDFGVHPAEGRNFPASEHPVAPTHPETGRKFLFVNEAFASHIVQLARTESDALLGLLFRHIERNLSFQVRVHWAADTLVAWDNWAPCGLGLFPGRALGRARLGRERPKAGLRAIAGGIAGAGAFPRSARSAKNHNKNASASSQGASTFSARNFSARVRPRLTAATGLPSRAAASMKRKPE